MHLLTDAWYDVELVVDLFVYSGGDDADFRESVGHRVDAHLCHQQGQQEDLILRYVVVLHKKRQKTVFMVIIRSSFHTVSLFCVLDTKTECTVKLLHL